MTFNTLLIVAESLFENISKKMPIWALKMTELHNALRERDRHEGNGIAGTKMLTYDQPVERATGSHKV